jgi:hypothetical protein
VADVAEPVSSVGRSMTASTTDRQSSPWLDRAVGAVEQNWRWALAALLFVDAVLLLYMGRGLTFFYDDWDFVTQDYGGGLHSLLAAHVGNISVFPVAVYKVLFHLAGLNHYAVFRLVVIVLHLIAATLIFTLASRRTSRFPALLATALILFLGAAWEDLLWAFQVGYMLSIVGGLTAWVFIERRDRTGDLLAMLALVVSAGSSSLGIPLVIGLAVELAWQRQWKRAWVVVVPGALYALWYLGYGESQITTNSLIATPGFAADLAAAAAGALVGRALEWGRPLAVLGLFFLLRRLVAPRPVSGRLVGLIATGASLWIVTATARSTISTPETSRYVYLGAVVIVLVGVELLQTIEISARAVAVTTVLVAFSAVSGLTVMHAGALGLRETSDTVAAELGALELAAAHAPPGYQPDPQRAPQITAGPYLHTVRAIGSSPADTAAQIVAAGSVPRENADRVLRELLDPEPVTVAPSSQASTLPAPTVEAAPGATVSASGSCLAIRPRQDGATVTISMPAGGVLVRDGAPLPVGLSVRRFGDGFALLSEGVPGHGVRALSLEDGASTVPWHLQVGLPGPVSICDLAP